MTASIPSHQSTGRGRGRQRRAIASRDESGVSEAAVEQVADRRQVLLGRGGVDQDDAVARADHAAVGQLGQGGEGGGPLGRPGEPALAPLVADHVADRVVGDGQGAAAGLADDPQDVDVADVLRDVQARGDRPAGGPRA